MKKLMFVFSFLLMVGMTANAQSTGAKKSCSKTCTKGQKKSCSKSAKTATRADGLTKVAAQMTEAEIAAEADQNIEKRVCSDSGTTSFYEKSVCAMSGSVSWSKVEYSADDKKFTQVAAASMERDTETPANAKKCCKKGTKSCDKGAKTCKKGDKKSCKKGSKVSDASTTIKAATEEKTSGM